MVKFDVVTNLSCLRPTFDDTAAIDDLIVLISLPILEAPILSCEQLNSPRLITDDASNISCLFEFVSETAV